MSKPILKLRSGKISVAVWENQGDKGAFRTFSIQKRYKDKESGEYKESKSLFVNEAKDVLAVMISLIASQYSPQAMESKDDEAESSENIPF